MGVQGWPSSDVSAVTSVGVAAAAPLCPLLKMAASSLMNRRPYPRVRRDAPVRLAGGLESTGWPHSTESFALRR